MDKFTQVCDYFDFLKVSRCLEALSDSGESFEPLSVTELKEVAKEHFCTSVLNELDDDDNFYIDLFQFNQVSLLKNYIFLFVFL